MFCTNCGQKMEEGDAFCTSCGTPVYDAKKQVESSTNNMVPTKQVSLEPYISKIKEYLIKCKDFIVKHKKPFIVGTSICAIIILSIILFNQFYDFTKISWDETRDSSVTHTSPTTLKLSVSAYDKEDNRITEISFKTDDGEIKSDGANVEWTLPKEDGEYTITAIAPSGKKIKKSVKVINLQDSDDNTTSLNGLLTDTEEDENADNDADGLTNAEEKKLGTDINVSDTDGDGLSDYYEVNVSKTDPLKKDTDGDGLFDGDELDLGLDPLKEDSKGDGVKDGDRSLTFTVEDKKLGISLQINGKGNIASTTIDSLKNSTFSDMDGILDQVYNFYSNGTIESAIVTISYDISDVQSKGLNEDNLTLYYFNEETKELEPLPTTVDKEKKVITVTLNHFSKYVIGDKDVVLTNKNVQILFVIDNSVSMYTENQLHNAGYSSVTGAVGNDSDFKRLTLTNNMIDMFTGNYQFGVSEFAGSYAKIKNFTSEKAEVKEAVNSMKSNWQTTLSGTHIITALNSGIKEFSSKEDEGKYLILLTDGKNTSGSLSSNKSSIIKNAKDKNVKICVIGLGDQLDDDDLGEIATETGCNFYNALDSSALDEIYSLIGADINYNYVDTDCDNKVDGMITANSGFLVNRDGFSFANFRSNKSGDGHCYGMATFAMLYYQNELPMQLSSYSVSKFYLSYMKTIDWESNGYDLSNTYFSKNKKLYDFKISNEALKIFLGDNPSDYRDRVENDTWMIKTEYYDLLENIGATISVKDYSGKDKDFTKYQSALLNIDNDTFNNAVSNDEAQLLNAIWRLFMLQMKDSNSTSFGPTPDRAFNELTTQLEQGTPVVIGIAGNHAINAIRLIQDTEDANKFKIEVYDNNYPGETRYIDVTRSKYNKIQLDYTAWTNEYSYKFMYDTDNDGTKEKISVELNYPIINYKKPRTS